MAPKRKYSQLDTPKKNKIIGAAQFARVHGIKYTQTSLAVTFEVSRSQVSYALDSELDRTGKQSELKVTNHQKLTERDLDRVELFLVENGSDGHTLTWDELASQFGFEVIGQTLRLRMAERAVGTFIAAEKPWIDPKLAAMRVQYATNMLSRYPKAEDWYHVRFSDEVHFGWGPEGYIRIIRHRGRHWRNHPECIHRKETRDTGNEDDNKRVHYWAAVGRNFKSPLIRYEVPSNKNGKMSYRVYIDSILEPVVSKWCLEDQPWTLEEDGDSGHGKGAKPSVVSRWKEAHGITKDSSGLHRYFFNCPQSPDLVPIEDCWSYPKLYVKKRPHWDNELVDELAYEAWHDMPQEWINKLIDTIPQRLQDVIDSGGQMVQARPCK